MKRSLELTFAVVMAALLASAALAADREPAFVELAGKLGFADRLGDEQFMNDHFEFDDRSPMRLTKIKTKHDDELAKLLVGDLVLDPFKELFYVELYGGALESITARDCPNLVTLQVYNMGSLESVSLGDLPELIRFDVQGSPISALDFSRCPKAAIINVSRANVAELSLAGHGEITDVDARNCDHLTKVLVPDSPKLHKVDLTSSPVAELALPASSTLRTLGLVKTKVESLDLSGHAELYNVELSKMKDLKSLNVKGLAELTNLYLDETELTAVDVTGCASLALLDLRGSSIKKVIAAGCEALTDDAIKRARDVEIVR